MRRLISFPTRHRPEATALSTVPHAVRHAVVALAAAAVMSIGSPASAQDTTAEAVFEEGVKLFESGNYEAACPKLKSAVTLSSSEALGGRLLLAECYEKLGRWASAG